MSSTGVNINLIIFRFSSIDMWGLGCLIWEAFNGPLTAAANLDAMDQVRKISY